jgi:sugar phosphate isomerase/epimerase
MAKPVIGAQLYTVREFTQTLAGVADTLRKIKAAGYSTVQLSGLGPMEARDLAAVISDSGLSVAATHTGWDRFRGDLDAVIKEHVLWGCRHTAIGGLPAEYFSADGVKRFIDEVREIAPRLAAEGMDFSYHNHNHELARINGRCWLEALYQEADPADLKAELDTYWIQAGGGDPAQWVRKCAGREPLLHLKDMCITPKREQRFAEIGRGNLNWPAILQAAEEGGVEILLVEQDNCYGRDPFESLRISGEYLHDMGYH